MLKALSMVAVCAGSVGCLDAKKSFDDYGTRVVDGNTSVPDRPNFTTIPDVTGHFLLATHPKGVGGDTVNIELLTDVVMTANADGTANFSYTASALELPDQIVSAGPPAGPQFSATDMLVGIDGTFMVPLAGTLPGDANPVIPGTSVAVTGVQHGEIRSTDLFCGTLTGNAGGLPLDGSTFAAIRIAPGTIGSALPPVVNKCPDTTPDAGT